MEGHIRVKKGTVSIDMEKGDLINADQSSDGIVFNLKGKMQLYVTDDFMDLRVKELIISSAKFPKGNLTIDLDNYNTPAKVEL